MPTDHAWSNHPASRNGGHLLPKCPFVRIADLAWYGLRVTAAGQCNWSKPTHRTNAEVSHHQRLFCARQDSVTFLKLHPMKIQTPSILIILMLVCAVAAGPNLRAVVPAPDGGYPGGNTAEGQNALLSLTSGGFNTGVGFLSLRSNTTGSFNTAIGAGTLLANTGSQNTAVGAGALLSNSIGLQNTATG